MIYSFVWSFTLLSILRLRMSRVIKLIDIGPPNILSIIFKNTLLKKRKGYAEAALFFANLVHKFRCRFSSFSIALT